MMQNAGTIAIVDDEIDIVEPISVYLKNSGYNVTVHKSGIDFLEYYKQSESISPDIVFLDIEMPHMNGLEVLEHSFQNLKLLQSIFVSFTGYLKEGDSRWLGFMGFDANIPKTIKIDQVLANVKNLIQNKNDIIAKRNPYKNLLAAIHELSHLRLRSAVLENNYIKKLISPEVFDILDTDPNSLIPQNRDIAVAFVDIRDFTKLMNMLPLQQVNQILRLFYEVVVEGVTKEKGFIDKFIADEVMWFHQSDSLEECSKQCIRSAIDIKKGIKELNKEIRNAIHPHIELRVGMGLACGPAAVGIFGTPKYRIQYSILGSPVNLASRLCSEARAGEILIGGDIIQYCSYKTRNIGFRIMKGFEQEVELRSLII